ncbi:MAG: glycoside hydrolase family 5 protein [Burkholderiaceae bacterium]|nr:glycoside hydrolase family 5 protein [Burkholderiaceae bacterium]
MKKLCLALSTVLIAACSAMDSERFAMEVDEPSLQSKGRLSAPLAEKEFLPPTHPLTAGAHACSFDYPPQERAAGCNRALARTINFGDMLDTPTEGLGPVLSDEFITLAKGAGFTAIRLTIRWDARADFKPPYTIDPDFFDRVDGAVKLASAQGLAVVIDMHHYAAMNTAPKSEQQRFLALWNQIAQHYRNAPATVMFELLNEPNLYLGRDMWQRVMSAALREIRASNPDRTLIVGGAPWNTLAALEQLHLPFDDRNLIVTFHYYDPIEVTHQGAEWVDGSDEWMGTAWRGSAAERQALKADFADVAQWAKVERRPIFLGEFGVYSEADDATRLAWTKAVREQAEANGFSWAYWELASKFGVLDPWTLDWREPLLQTLLPQSPVLGANARLYGRYDDR